MLSLNLICAFINLLLGMCERVRTRNALHEVGAALTRDEHETRSSTGVERQRELSEPPPHIFSPHHNYQYFHNFIIIIYIFYAQHTHLNKTSKTRVNSTSFEAIYSNFRVLGALFNNKIFIKYYNFNIIFLQYFIK